MKYSTEETKELLINCIPVRMKSAQIQKDFIINLILNSLLAAGSLLGIILSIVNGKWVLFSLFTLAILAIAVLFLNTFKCRAVLSRLTRDYSKNVEAGNYQVLTDSIVQKTFNSDTENLGRYSITLESGVTKNLFKYFYELCSIGDTVYTIQVEDFPIPTGFVLVKNTDSDREYPLN